MGTLRRSLLPFLALALACGPDAGPGNPDVDDAPTISASEELRIGSTDDPEIGFSSIAGVTVGTDGRVYVLEREEKEVRVYNAAGARIGGFGGSGDGPGEFRMPFGLGMIGDTLWVGDPVQRRLSLFDADGRFLRTIRTASIMVDLTPTQPAQLVGDGLREDGWIHTTWMIPVSREMPRDSVWLPHARIDTTGTILDTIWLQRFGFLQPDPIKLGGRTLYPPAPPPDFPLYVENGDEWYKVERPVASSGAGATFTVTRVARMADTVWHRTFAYRPRPFTHEALDSLLESRVASYRRSGEIDADAVAAAFRGAMSPPAFFPPVSRGRVGRGGILWLRREDEPGTTDRWLLLRPDGEPAGTVELPRGATVYWSDSSVVWAAVRDSLDVPWLVRYRLVGLAP